MGAERAGEVGLVGVADFGRNLAQRHVCRQAGQRLARTGETKPERGRPPCSGPHSPMQSPLGNSEEPGCSDHSAPGDNGPHKVVIELRVGGYRLPDQTGLGPA